MLNTHYGPGQQEYKPPETTKPLGPANNVFESILVQKFSDLQSVGFQGFVINPADTPFTIDSVVRATLYTCQSNGTYILPPLSVLNQLTHLFLIFKTFESAVTIDANDSTIDYLPDFTFGPTGGSVQLSWNDPITGWQIVGGVF